MTTTPLSPAELREMLEKACPLPWWEKPDDGGRINGRYDSEGTASFEIGRVYEDAERTLIVSAVNSLPGILEELERVRELLRCVLAYEPADWSQASPNGDDLREAIRYALGVSP